jgi:hypothetical protein
MLEISGGHRGVPRALAAALAVIAVTAGARETRAQAPAEPELDRYELDAALVPERNEVTAAARITWHNRSEVPIDALFFHLYANAFANERTVFMREQGQRLRGTKLERRGGIDVIALRGPGGVDLLARAHLDLERDDATQMRVDLPAPLAPGGRIELQLRFRVQLPSIVARMGAADDFFMIAQWFPKLAMLERDGRWQSFPYHGLGEFYAEFADYDLRLRVPRGYVVAAPGVRTAHERQPDGTLVAHYVLRRAIDVAWAAWPGFRVVRTSESGSAAASASAGTLVEVFAPPGHTALATEQAAFAQQTLAKLGATLGTYPYGRIVVVLPPPSAIGAAGMEYPGLVVGWPVTPASELNPVARAMLDVVTAHELAHQWFAIVLASDETQAPVLDEGLAEWAGLDAVRERYGRSFFEGWLGLPLDLFELHRAAYARAAQAPSSLRPAYSYTAQELGTAVYLRPALALESVARTWGRARLYATLGAYARAQRFAHPGAPDLWRAFDRGYWPGFSQQVLQPALSGTSFDTHLQPVQGTPGTLRAQRETGAGMPETIEGLDARGLTRAAWPAGETVQVHAAAPPLLGASVDPERHNLLDRARADDQLRVDARSPASPLLARMLLWAQALLAGLGP